MVEKVEDKMKVDESAPEARLMSGGAVTDTVIDFLPRFHS